MRKLVVSAVVGSAALVIGACTSTPPPGSPGASSSTPTTVVSPSSSDPPIEPTPEDRTVIGPSKTWSKKNTVTLWVADRLSVAVVHGLGGYYVLDLRGVQECPADVREGEGEHVDEQTQDIVFTCADGREWARFNVYGQPVPGSPYRLPRPAYTVLAQQDGSLVIGRRPPPQPLTAYWPAPTTSAAAAAGTLFDAWQANDRAAAFAIASRQAVTSLWMAAPSGYEFAGSCDPGRCAFLNTSRLVGFWLVVKKLPAGYFVERADIGTIESEGES